MRSTPFNLGFQEIRKGKPLNYDAFPHDCNAQWQYERGRQFAYVFGGKLKVNNKLSYYAIEAFHQALWTNLVF
jgi:hypothetical protein